MLESVHQLEHGQNKSSATYAFETNWVKKNKDETLKELNFDFRIVKEKSQREAF